jgi:hypothetical protein
VVTEIWIGLQYSCDGQAFSFDGEPITGEFPVLEEGVGVVARFAITKDLRLRNGIIQTRFARVTKPTLLT